MLHIHRGALAGALALVSTVASSVPIAPLPIASQDAGARAVFITLSAQGIVSRPIGVHVETSRQVARNTLQLLGSLTTPATLVQADSALSFNCPLAGNITARLPRNGPRLLRLSWTHCSISTSPGYSIAYDGEGDFLLPANTFTPDALLGLRLGSSLRDFTQMQHYQDETPGSVLRQSLNLSIAGRLPLTRNGTLYIGSFAYVLNGRLDSHNEFPNPDPALPPYVQDEYNKATNYTVVGATTVDTTNLTTEDQLTVLLGSGDFRVDANGVPTGLSSSFRAEGLRIRRTFDFHATTSTLTVDGKLDYHWPDYMGGTCGDGLYNFHTLTPIRQPNVFRFDARDTGLLTVNNATLSFSLTDPPAVPEYYTPQPDERPGLATVDMGAAGTFTHASYQMLSTVQGFAHCVPN